MVLTISLVRLPGADTPMNTSAPLMTSERGPAFFSRLEILAISFLMSLRPSRPSYIAPLRSHSMTFLRPLLMSSLVIAIPAAPEPLTTTERSSSFLPTSLSALSIAARVTTAVPCWSSWKTGMSHTSLSFFSISKHLGAEISSRLMPPKLPASSCTVLTMSSTSLERMQRGKASTSPNVLNSAHLPSMTGMPASGPMSPRPSTAVPSVTTATRLPLRVYLYERSTFSEILRQGSATPGVYATASSSRLVIGALVMTSILPCHSSCFLRANSFLSMICISRKNYILRLSRKLRICFAEYCSFSISSSVKS